MSRIYSRAILSVVWTVLWYGVASAQGVFFVDPDYGGANGPANGSATKPWTRLDTTAWATINASLGASDVTVYFSAKEASGEAAEELGTDVICKRTDKSSYRLTLDGMTVYNTNDANPSAGSWVTNPNPSTHKMKLVNGGSGIALGWYRGMGYLQSNITLRGFETSGTSARVGFGGDNLVIEHLYVHDIPNDGPAMGLLYAMRDDVSCVLLGISHNVTIRNNIIERTYGEALYIGGTDNCPAYGNTHDTILIENNRIVDAGYYGGQGDGIDIKDGMTNVTVRRNRITNTHSGGCGMTIAGGYGGVDQHLVVEWNIISGAVSAGILVGSNWGDPFGYTLRYNTITGSARQGISLSGNSALDIDHVTIQGNTISANGSMGIYAAQVDYLSVLNNLVFGNNPSSPNYQISVDLATRNSGTAVNDHNLYSPGSSDVNANAISGGHNEIRTDSSGLRVDPLNPGWNSGAHMPAPSAPTGLIIR